MEPVCYIKVEPVDDLGPSEHGQHCKPMIHHALVKSEPPDNASTSKQPNRATSDNDKTFFSQTNCVSTMETKQCNCSYCNTADNFVSTHPEENHNLIVKPTNSSFDQVKISEGLRSNVQVIDNQGTERVLISDVDSVNGSLDYEEHLCLRTSGKKSTNCEHCNRLFKKELEEVSRLLEMKRKVCVLEESVAKHKKKQPGETRRFLKQDGVHPVQNQMYNTPQTRVHTGDCTERRPDNLHQTDPVRFPCPSKKAESVQQQEIHVDRVYSRVSTENTEKLSQKVRNGQIHQNMKHETGTEHQLIQETRSCYPRRIVVQHAPSESLAETIQQQSDCHKHESVTHPTSKQVSNSHSPPLSVQVANPSTYHDDKRSFNENLRCEEAQQTSNKNPYQLVQPVSNEHTHQEDCMSRSHQCSKNGSVEHHDSHKTSKQNLNEVFGYPRSNSEQALKEQPYPDVQQDGHSQQLHEKKATNNKRSATEFEKDESCKHENGRKGKTISKCASCDKLFREKLQQLENLQVNNAKPPSPPKAAPKPKSYEVSRNKCPGCHKQFFERMHQLDLQLRTIHRPICCSKCSLLFSTTSAFEHHKCRSGESKQKADQETGKEESTISADGDLTSSVVDQEDSETCICSKSHPNPMELFSTDDKREPNSTVQNPRESLTYISPETNTEQDAISAISQTQNVGVKECPLVVTHPELKAQSADEKRPYQCRICQKCFRNECHLEYHIRTHTGEKPHVCEVCGRSFAQPSVLLRHFRRVHTDERPFKCPECTKPFFTYSEMKKHLERH